MQLACSHATDPRPSAAARSRCPRPASSRSTAPPGPGPPRSRPRTSVTDQSGARPGRASRRRRTGPGRLATRAPCPTGLHGRTAANEHERTADAAVPDLARLEERRVKPMIEADLDDDATCLALPRRRAQARRRGVPRAFRRSRVCRARRRRAVSAASASLVVATTTRSTSDLAMSGLSVGHDAAAWMLRCQAFRAVDQRVGDCHDTR